MSMDAATQERKARLWSPPNGHTSSELDILSAPSLRRKQILTLKKISIIERNDQARRRFVAMEKSIEKVAVAAKQHSYQQSEKERILAAEPPLLDQTIRRVTVKRVVETVRLYFKLPMTAMVGRRKDRETVHARQVAMYLARELTLRSYEVIGVLLGNRDHSTIIHGCRRVEWYLERNVEPWCGEVATLRDRLMEAP